MPPGCLPLIHPLLNICLANLTSTPPWQGLARQRKDRRVVKIFGPPFRTLNRLIYSPHPTFQVGQRFFLSFWVSLRFFCKTYFFGQPPLLTGHTGLQPRRAETPQKSVNPANGRAYLVFMVCLASFRLFCFFSLRSSPITTLTGLTGPTPFVKKMFFLTTLSVQERPRRRQPPFWPPRGPTGEP